MGGTAVTQPQALGKESHNPDLKKFVGSLDFWKNLPILNSWLKF